MTPFICILLFVHQLSYGAELDFYLKKSNVEKKKVSLEQNDICLLTRESFADLMAQATKEGRDYILGTIKTQQDDGSEKVHFVDGVALRNFIKHTPAYNSQGNKIKHPLFPGLHPIKLSKIIYFIKQLDQERYREIGSEADLAKNTYAGNELYTYFSQQKCQPEETFQNHGEGAGCGIILTAVISFVLLISILPERSH